MGKAQKDEQWEKPRRDLGGRFKKGVSGNPNGRPRKPPEPLWSFERSFRRELAEQVQVSGGDGRTEKIAIRDLLIKSLLRNAVKATPKEQLAMLGGMAKLNLLFPSDEEEQGSDDSLYTEEDRRILRALSKEVFPDG